MIDIKPANILVNYGQGENRFTDVQLADLESVVHVDSPPAEKAFDIGTPVFNSPESLLSIKWNTSTDIWSFGAMVCLSIIDPTVCSS